MRRVLILLFVGLVLTSTSAYAESPKNDPHAGHQMSSNDMGNMDMGNMDMDGMDMGNMETGHGSGHEHGASLTETPPNYRILSGFALVNLLFLLIGAILKMRKQKGGAVQ